MNVLKSITFILTLLLLHACASSPLDQQAELVITDIIIIDPEDGVQEHKTIKIFGNKIQAIEDYTTDQSYSGATVIDGAGKFIMPGLWDAHVHLVYIEDLAPAMFDLFLSYGVTSVRDTGGQLDLVQPWKAKADNDPKHAPRVKIAGPLVDGVPTVYDGSPGRPHLGIGASNPERAKIMVDSLVHLGVDLIKSYEMLTPESFAAVLEQSKKHNKIVTGHIPLSMDAITASNAGMRSMEHLRNLEFSFSSEHEALLQQRLDLLEDGKADQGGILRSRIHNAQRLRAMETVDPKRRALVLSQLAKNETWQIPTLSIMTVASDRLFENEEWKKTFQYLPQSVDSSWHADCKTVAESPTTPTNQALGEWGVDMIKYVREANVDIMAGTDTPIFFLTPGASLHRELELLVQGGLTPLEAIESATSKPAAYFNMQDSLGRVAPNMLADLVILDENPIDDIRHTKTIHAVIRDGHLITQEGLVAMKEKLKKL